uniref:Uncharacterized protein n=1 Tax=Triticum urartu TaxID=4572 RepID=A0A8R7TY66_TRIUA
ACCFLLLFLCDQILPPSRLNGRRLRQVHCSPRRSGARGARCVGGGEDCGPGGGVLPGQPRPLARPGARAGGGGRRSRRRRARGVGCGRRRLAPRLPRSLRRRCAADSHGCLLRDGILQSELRRVASVCFVQFSWLVRLLVVVIYSVMVLRTGYLSLLPV